VTENEIGTIVVDCAVRLHQDLGPGLLETVYEVVLAKKLEQRGLSVQRQVPVPIEHEGLKFEEGFRADLIVDQKVIIELKSVETFHPAHKKQLLTYLRLRNNKLGYLLNFGSALMKDGITRIINGQLEQVLVRRPLRASAALCEFVHTISSRSRPAPAGSRRRRRTSRGGRGRA
jgi:GxxExxY protein